MPFTKGWNKKNNKSSKANPETPEAKAEVKPEVSTSPIHKAFYIEKKNSVWCLNMIEIQDDKVISRKVKEDMNKMLALESFKLQFAKTFFIGQ